MDGTYRTVRHNQALAVHPSSVLYADPSLPPVRVRVRVCSVCVCVCVCMQCVCVCVYAVCVCVCAVRAVLVLSVRVYLFRTQYLCVSATLFHAPESSPTPASHSPIHGQKRRM